MYALWWRFLLALGCWALMMGLEIMAQTQPVEEVLYHLNLSQGLPTLKTFDLAQDQRGYIWVATPTGLLRYDGYRPKRLSTLEGLPNNDIRHVHFDRQNRLWVLTYGPLARSSDLDTFTSLSDLPFISERRFSSIQEAGDGTIWLAGGRELYSIDSTDSVQRIGAGTLKLSGSPYLLLTDTQGQVWGHGGRQLFCLNLQREIQYVAFAGSPPQGNVQLVEIADGRLVYNQAEGLFALDPRTGHQELLVDQKVVPSDSLQTLMVSPDGSLWLGHQTQGAFQLIPQQKGFLPGKHYLEGSGISQIFSDREKNLWFATREEGVYHLSISGSLILDRNNRMRQRLGAWAFLLAEPSLAQAVSDSCLWLVSQAGKLYSFRKGLDSPVVKELADLSPYFLPGGGPQAVALQVLPQNGLLIATPERLLWWKEDRLEVIYGFKGPVDIDLGQDGALLVTLREDRILNCSLSDLNALTDTLQAEEVLDRLLVSQGFFRAARPEKVVKGADGAIWYTNPGGLFRRVPGEKEAPFMPEETLFRSGISDLTFDELGQLWVATHGSGLLVIDTSHTTFRQIGQEQGLRSNVCLHLFADLNQGQMWIGTNNGLGKIAGYQDQAKPLQVVWLDRYDGLPGAEVRGLVRYGDELLVTTAAGDYWLHEQELFDHRLPPLVYLTEVAIGGTAIELANRYILAPSDNLLEISFSGICFRHLGELVFSYQLEGVDPGWTTTRTPQVRYTNLPAGSYTFRLRAITPDGIISEREHQFELVKRPFFYQTWWFLSLVGLSLVLAAAGILRYLYIDQQRNLMEQTVAERTAELNHKVEELHRINLDLEQFAYVASHDLKTPLRNVIAHLQLLEKRHPNMPAAAKPFLHTAVDGAKRMYEMINDLLAFARLGQEGKPAEPVALDQVVAEVMASLSETLASRNATVKTGPLPEISGIRSSWKVLFQNLIENGLKFNEASRPQVQIASQESPDYWIIRVRDNGIGIAEEYQDRIFDLFERLHSEAEYAGTGIGLAMCKRVVEQQGGAIWIESDGKSGTTFAFTIPKKAPNLAMA